VKGLLGVATEWLCGSPYKKVGKTIIKINKEDGSIGKRIFCKKRKPHSS